MKKDMANRVVAGCDTPTFLVDPQKTNQMDVHREDVKPMGRNVNTKQVTTL